MTKAQKTLNRLYAKHKTWRKVAEHLKVNKGVVYSVAKGRIAATPQICKALGLPIERHVPAPVCPRCGELHLTKRCTRRNPKPQAQIDAERLQRERRRLEKYVRDYNG